uniref:Keratin, type II cytoskeletal 8 n=1 Tax=Oryctolagus cuniculus TaxID=9986 RepID=G1U3P5_RABIT
MELPSPLDGLADEVSVLRQLNEEKIPELQSQVSSMAVVPSLDNSQSLDVDGIFVEVCTQYKDITNCSCAEARSRYQIKDEEMKTLLEISEVNRNISWLQTEIEALKGQRASLEAATRMQRSAGSWT